MRIAEIKNRSRGQSKTKNPRRVATKWRRRALINPELFDLAVERRKADVQEFGGFLAVLVGLLEHPCDMPFLELTEGVAEIKRKRGLRFTAGDHRCGQIFQCDALAFGEDHRMLDDVVELAHVTLPRQCH